MRDHLEGLSAQERAACTTAERVLGAVAEPWDVRGRQGAVDAMLTLADGRRAAFEVTALAEDGALHLDAMLSRDGFQWPNPGRWWWTVSMGSVRDLPRLKKIYPRVIEMCEAAGTAHPERLRRVSGVDDEDLTWLVKESASSMRGAPDLPSRDGDVVRDVMVTPDGRGGVVDRSLSGLAPALRDAFRKKHLAAHLNKVALAGADERHLFIVLHDSALPSSVTDGLSMGDRLPPAPPPLPEGVTHLWLAPQFGLRLLLWTPDGWQQHPYD